VNVSRDECKKSRIEFRLSVLVYSFGGCICTERSEGNWFFFHRLELFHFGSAVGEGVDLRWLRRVLDRRSENGILTHTSRIVVAEFEVRYSCHSVGPLSCTGMIHWRE